MEENRKSQQALGTELERSGSGVPSAAAAGGAPEDAEHTSQHPAVTEKPVEAEPAIDEDFPVEDDVEEEPISKPRLMANFNTQRKTRVPHLVKKHDRIYNKPFTPEQRLLLLDTWTRSGLPAKDFASLVGVSYQSLCKWKRSFTKYGPEGLLDEKRGAPKGSRLSETTRRTILMIKESNPEYGVQRISDMLYRGLAVNVSPNTISDCLKEEGYELEPVPTKRHPDKVRRFERARPNQLWQTDLFTFILKRQNRRVHLVAFMDDNSRFIVGYGLHASASGALVLEVLRAAIASYQTPEEILTDNGTQYITWRGKSRFAKECEKWGIKQVVAKPRRPQTLGKIERFWGTLWRECVESAVFLDLGDARQRIGLFIDYYNFQRTHQGIDGLVPADRFFHAAPEVLNTLKQRVDANALKYAKSGVPKEPFYMTGNVGGKPFSVHAEGEHVYMVGEDGAKKEVDLLPPEDEAKEELPEPVSLDGSPETRMEEAGESAPGTSPLDGALEQIEESLDVSTTADYNTEEGED
jgi:transposase InsO family protein